MKKFFALICLLALAFSLSFCGNGGADENFSFSLKWGYESISSYDSVTGRLVKTTDATNPDDYVTYYSLTEKNKKEIYELILALDASSYPDEYDPKNGNLHPKETLVLTVRMNGTEKTVTAEAVPLREYAAKDEKGQRFLDTCWAICDILTESKEWKALPDYEFYYE